MDLNSTGPTLALSLSLVPHGARNSRDLAQNVTGKFGLSSAWCRLSLLCPAFHKHFPSSTLASLWVTSQNSCHQGRRVLTSGTVISPPQALPSPSSLPPITANPCLTLNCDQDQLKPCLTPIAISFCSLWWGEFVRVYVYVCTIMCTHADAPDSVCMCVCVRTFCECGLKKGAITESHLHPLQWFVDGCQAAGRACHWFSSPLKRDERQ